MCPIQSAVCDHLSLRVFRKFPKYRRPQIPNLSEQFPSLGQTRMNRTVSVGNFSN